MQKLTNDQLKVSHAWLHDVFIWGGFMPADKAKRTNYKLMYGSGYRDYASYATTICDAIQYRPVDYKKMAEIDNALDRLSKLLFSPELNTTSAYPSHIAKPVNMLAKYIANFCKEANFIWDDSITSEYEMEEIKKTIIGKALWDFECFLSQVNAKKAVKQPTASNTSPRQPGQPPKNNYKSSGPQSQNVINLIGQPNQKVYANNRKVYCIIADKVSKNTPNAFVKPLSKQANSKGVNEVFMGGGTFFTDCKCWFDNLNEAKNFLLKVQNKFTNFTNYRIGETNADKNGYFLVKTEFGDCAIKASRLNEEVINEDTAKEEPKKVKYTTNVAITDENFDAFENALFK